MKFIGSRVVWEIDPFLICGYTLQSVPPGTKTWLSALARYGEAKEIFLATCFWLTKSTILLSTWANLFLFKLIWSLWSVLSHVRWFTIWNMFWLEKQNNILPSVRLLLISWGEFFNVGGNEIVACDFVKMSLLTLAAVMSGSPEWSQGQSQHISPYPLQVLVCHNSLLPPCVCLIVPWLLQAT